MQITQFVNLLVDGVIHEIMRWQSALDRIGVKRGILAASKLNLVTHFLDSEAG